MSVHGSKPLHVLSPRQLLGLLVTFSVMTGSALAQQYTDIRRLGTSNAISRPGPQTGDDLQRVFRENRADYEKILREAGWPGDAEEIFQAIANGDFQEASYPVGHTFEWMALRRNGVAQPSVPIRWAGDDPFEAFEIRVESGGVEYRFLIPKACGNLALVGERDLGPDPIPTAAPRLNVQAPNQCTGVQATVDVTIAGGMPPGGSLELTLTRPSGQRETLQPSGASNRWQGTLDDAGAYTFSAVVTRGSERTQVATERLNIEACQPTCNLTLDRPPLDPAPRAGRSNLGINMCQSSARVGSLTSKTVRLYHTPIDGVEALIDTISLDAECSTTHLMEEYGSYRLEGEVTDDRGLSATCQADYTLMKPETLYGPFFTGWLGNERRWRPGIEDEATPLPSAAFGSLRQDEEFQFDRSAALLGLAGGYMWPVGDGSVGVFGQGGVAINLRDSENTSIYADFGVDKMFEKGFFGGGVGVWDINHSDTFDGSFFLHGGWNINEKMQFYLEGRLFMSMLDMIDNNFVYLGGIRYFFKQ